MGPVDAQVYLEEMSWNEGWKFFVCFVSPPWNFSLLFRVKENIRDVFYKVKHLSCNI